MKSFSFFVPNTGSGEIRGNQVATRMGAKINPVAGFDDDVCIWVKMQPTDTFPKHSYLDVMDAPERLRWLKAHPNIGVIAISKLAKKYLSKLLNREDVIFIPEHHCNFERFIKPRKDPKVVGTCGLPTSLQLPLYALETKLKNIGLQFYPLFKKRMKGREEVVDYYKQIDIQIVFRPNFSGQEWSARDFYLRNPLKLANASAFGIPTVCYPELNYVLEYDGYFIPAMDIDQLIDGVKRLKENPLLYDRYSSNGIVLAEKYHIDNVLRRYHLLGCQEFKVSISGKMLVKQVVIDGKPENVYGLASYRATPKGAGFGKAGMKALLALAKDEDKVIVGFCDDRVLGFYLNCGFYKCGEYKGLNIFASRQIKDIKATETW